MVSSADETVLAIRGEAVPCFVPKDRQEELGIRSDKEAQIVPGWYGALQRRG